VVTQGVGRCRQGEAVFRSQIGNIVGSDLSPIAAECRPISACSTQNKAKRANKIVFLLLIRDQEVSRPKSPIRYLECYFFLGSKIRETPVGI
jgi:hypothetical protein